MDLKSLEKKISAGEIDTVLAVMVDMQGRLMGKRVTGRFFLEDVAKHGIHACAYLLTVDINMEPIPGYKMASWKTGYQDFHLRPDWNTLRSIPWLSKTALVICDIAGEDGKPIEVSPRFILKKQIERAKQAGYTVKTASELEFYLFKETFESARSKNYHDLEPSGAYIEDYHVLQTTRDEPFIQAVRNAMEGAGVPVESSKGEWGPGQQEINLTYTHALEMADRHTIYKNGVKEMAALHNCAVTFMAKYDERQAGSSFHLHSSLWDPPGEKSLFFDPGRPLGMSDLFRHYLGGQLSLARELAWFFAPTGNSYKRYQAGTFAPTKIVWSRDNRTCGLRVIGEGEGLRLENRLPGADANPYLAFAATIAAGLKGIQEKIEPPGEFQGDAYAQAELPRVPGTLHEAIDALEKSRAAREAFSDEVIDHYLHAARVEAAAYDQAVGCWERDRYFERI